ncbi:MAG: thiazole biosynthesis protein [Archaeoglobus sp.]|nr:thiazole biosynthesis protein [Archaeoglobus sp.]
MVSNEINEITISKAIAEKYFEKLKASLESEVVIVGGGPSGLVAAYYLSSKGYEATLLEKKLSLGGGIWGGGMMFNKVVVQSDALEVLDEFEVSYEKYDEKHFVADAIELAGALIYKASKKARLFNLINVEDVMVRDGKITGLVVNYTPVEMSNLHIDPITIAAKAVVDATGHDAFVCNMLSKKTGELELKGEKYMHAEMGEKGVVEYTSEVYPGLFVAGMTVAAVYGLPRMGPIFGGMLLSGRKVAELIESKLRI